MPTLQEVSSDHIFPLVMKAAESARRLIRATMDVDEEMRRPLPEEYFLLLKKKLDEGVHLHRVAFGSPSSIKRFISQRLTGHPKEQFFVNKTNSYHRMILIDDRILFFATESAQGRRFFLTYDHSWISHYLHYFQKISEKDSPKVKL